MLTGTTGNGNNTKNLAGTETRLIKKKIMTVGTIAETENGEISFLLAVPIIGRDCFDCDSNV